MNTNQNDSAPVSTLYANGIATVTYADGSSRVLTADDQVIVSRTYEEGICRSCVEDTRIMVTRYRDGRESHSKCGRCYL